MNAAEKELDLTTDDIELLFHLFWLPHGHGPRGEMLVNEFKYLRDTAHVIMGRGRKLINWIVSSQTAVAIRLT